MAGEVDCGIVIDIASDGFGTDGQEQSGIGTDGFGTDGFGTDGFGTNGIGFRAKGQPVEHRRAKMDVYQPVCGQRQAVTHPALKRVNRRAKMYEHGTE